MTDLNIKTYSACAVASCILDMHAQNVIPYMGITKLIKLVYIAQGCVLGQSRGKEMLFLEDVEAWHYGPAIRSLFGEMKASEEAGEEIPLLLSYKEEAKELKKDKKSYDIISEVVKYYHDYTAYRLTEITHEEGTPWHWATENKKLIIPKEIIADYYASKYPLS